MATTAAKTAVNQPLGEPYVVYASSQRVPYTPLSTKTKIILVISCLLISFISIILMILAYSESDAFPYMPLCLLPMIVMITAWLTLCFIFPHRWHPVFGRSVKVPNVQVIIPPNNNTDGKTSYYGYQAHTSPVYQQTSVKQL